MPGCAGVCPGSAEQAHRPQPWSPVAGSCVGLREEDAEPATGIGPHLLTGEAGFCQEQAEAGGGVLVRVFGMMYSPRRNWRTAELPSRTVCGRVAIRRISMRLFRAS